MGVQIHYHLRCGSLALGLGLAACGGTVEATDTEDTTSSLSATAAPRGSVAAAYAVRQIGCSYRFGAVGPCGAGFGTPGLVLAAWQQEGVTLPNSIPAQRQMMPLIAAADLRPGDLVFSGPNLTLVGICTATPFVPGCSRVVYVRGAGSRVSSDTLADFKNSYGVHSYGRPQ
jgi:cell wall-associated NlpC family hydrolase